MLGASHAIEGGMYIESVAESANKEFMWFVPIDYTDPETPIPRKFLVHFAESDSGIGFNDTFQKCSEDMKGHSVNHKLVSLLAAGSPKKEPKKVKEVSDNSIEETKRGLPKPHDVCANLRESFSQMSKEILEPKVSGEVIEAEVKIVQEVLPNGELLMKEKELLLPRGFYNYLQKPPCEGCIGCEDDEVVNEGAKAFPLTTAPPLSEHSTPPKSSFDLHPSRTGNQNSIFNQSAIGVYNNIFSNVSSQSVSADNPFLNLSAHCETQGNIFASVSSNTANIFSKPENIFNTSTSLALNNSDNPFALPHHEYDEDEEDYYYDEADGDYEDYFDKDYYGPYSEQ